MSIISFAFHGNKALHFPLHKWISGTRFIRELEGETVGKFYRIHYDYVGENEVVQYIAKRDSQDHYLFYSVSHSQGDTCPLHFIDLVDEDIYD